TATGGSSKVAVISANHRARFMDGFMDSPEATGLPGSNTTAVQPRVRLPHALLERVPGILPGISPVVHHYPLESTYHLQPGPRCKNCPAPASTTTWSPACRSTTFRFPWSATSSALTSVS